MGKLIFNDKEEVELKNNSPIKEVCEEMGVPFACEEGICGSCIIEIAEGNENLTPMTEQELDFLGEQDIENIERLACQCKLKKGCVKIKF